MPAPMRSLLRPLPRGAGAQRDRAERHDRRTSTLEVAAGHDDPRGRQARRRAGCPTLCFDERQAPFGACRVCMVGVEGAPKPLPACTTPVSRRDGDRHRRTRPRAGSPRRVVELVLSELPEPPAPHTELAQVADRLEVTDTRWPGATHARRARLPPPVPRLPARALHLLRPLRARLRRGPGRVRADRDRPRLHVQHHGRASTPASRTRAASPAAPAPTPARPTRSPRSRSCP